MRNLLLVAAIWLCAVSPAHHSVMSYYDDCNAAVCSWTDMEWGA